MNNPFETKNDMTKLNNAAYDHLNMLNEHTKENIMEVAKTPKKAAEAIASKAVKKSKEALKELSDKLSENNQTNDSSISSQGRKKLKNKVLRNIGDKARSGISKGKNIAKIGKGAKIGKNAAKAANMAKIGSKGLKGFKLVRNLKKARSAIKLAQIGRAALTGGAAIAGGPVGIALFVGSFVAPYAIEAIWKNREKIYEGGKSIVSKLSEKDIKDIAKAKQGQVGETVETKDLKIEGDNGKTLLEVDDQGKILTNEFTQESNLAFYQEKDGEKVMVMDEEWLEDPELEIDESENTTIEPGQKLEANSQSNSKQDTEIQSPPLEKEAVENPQISSEQNTKLPPPPPPIEIENVNSQQINSETTVEIGNKQKLIRPNAVIPETLIPEPEIPQNLNQSAIAESAISPPVETQETVATEEMVSGIDVVQNSLENLVANNQGNTQIKNQQEYFRDTIDVAQENSFAIEPDPQILHSNEKPNFNQNKAGSSIIDLFEANSADGEHLATKDYDIQRRGRSYFLKDLEGNVLLEARKPAVGTKINQNNLNPAQKQDLNFLREDLEENKGITGGFKLAIRAAKSAIALTPGATMIRLFNENAKSLADGEGLSTDKYNINKEGNVYKLSDKEGNLLFSAQRTSEGKIATKGKLTESLKQDFRALQNDLSQGRVISGAFKIATRALGAVFMASPGGKIVNLFNNHSKDGNNLQTENYDISRKDNNYFVKDRQNQKLLMRAKITPDNVESTISNNSQLKTDLQNLGQSLNNTEITGGFKPEANSHQIDSTPLVNRFEKYQTTDTLPKGTTKETVKAGSMEL
ncbi:MAG: hypothetical protein WBM44_11415 [Waterburya sp.]